MNERSSQPSSSESDDESVIERAYAWLIRLESGNLSATERAEFEHWIAEAPVHRRAFEEARRLWRNTDLLEALRRTRPAETTRRRIAGWPWPTVAVAVALVLLLLIGYRFDPLTRVQADHVTATGERSTIVLADGSTLTLDTATAVAVELGETRRIRLLKGAVYCEVSPDPVHPFVVTTRNTAARVLGTRFSVRTEHGADTVTVAQGSVRVTRNATPEDARVLYADEQTTAYTDRFGAVVKTRAQPILAWTRGSLVFEQTPLADAIERIQSYRRGIVLLRNPKLRDFRISGRFELDEPDRILDALAKTLPIEVHRYTPWVTVIR
ncbi:anti-FecI sigma factor, FecR [Methylocaldum marinum]|uniref:Anti-FecI sigma factor, FecR n=1 Tax=Methylocaldum marinum TaxID=1432792 RepID=A0A250KYI3_9GAMM|nr:FecR family protein [Methylocaldum marinum]BBA36677.1 anti-FecI sigma factor, FecR [Methylocaldum marinum]